MDLRPLLEQSVQWIISTGLRLIVIIILGTIVWRISRTLIGRVFTTLKSKSDDPEGLKRLDTLESVLRYAVSIVLLVIVVVMVLSALEINVGPVLAAAGIVGLAVGFGAQQLVQDVISGFFILMENQIRVGDVVNIAGKAGLVEKVNLRMTILRDLSGHVHYVRNGSIDTVSNLTKDFSFYLFDIGVAYRENVDEVIGVIREVDEEMRQDEDFAVDILDPIEVLGLDKFADSAIIIKARIKTRPIKQWRIGREFNRRLKMKFNERDIEIPFPHMTVYMGQDKQGQAPPMHVELDKGDKG